MERMVVGVFIDFTFDNGDEVGVDDCTDDALDLRKGNAKV